MQSGTGPGLRIGINHPADTGRDQKTRKRICPHLLGQNCGKVLGRSRHLGPKKTLGDQLRRGVILEILEAFGKAFARAIGPAF